MHSAQLKRQCSPSQTIPFQDNQRDDLGTVVLPEANNQTPDKHNMHKGDNKVHRSILESVIHGSPAIDVDGLSVKFQRAIGFDRK
jgi:hypothetical protein